MNFIARICLSTIAIVSITGCDNGGPTQSHNATEVTEDSHDHGHDHGSEGPHGGHILGLGDEEFEKANKVKINYTIGERRKGDIEKIYSDNTLIKNKLKWKAEKSLRQALVDAWNWELNKL